MGNRKAIRREIEIALRRAGVGPLLPPVQADVRSRQMSRLELEAENETLRATLAQIQKGEQIRATSEAKLAEARRQEKLSLEQEIASLRDANAAQVQTIEQLKSAIAERVEEIRVVREGTKQVLEIVEKLKADMAEAQVVTP